MMSLLHDARTHLLGRTRRMREMMAKLMESLLVFSFPLQDWTVRKRNQQVRREPMVNWRASVMMRKTSDHPWLVGAWGSPCSAGGMLELWWYRSWSSNWRRSGYPVSPQDLIVL